MNKPPLVLVIIDGFGHNPNQTGNAIALAKKPNLDFLSQNYPHTLLQASGQTVGLDWGEAGNSEVGHLTLGAGRVVKHYLSIINESIGNGEFFKNKHLLTAAINAKQNKAKLHLAGLLTSGSVHASLKHLLALVEFVKKTNIGKVFLHLFLDGKDSGLKESIDLLKKLEKEIGESEQIKIATIIGRDYAMDRNNHWDKTKTAFELIADGHGEKTGNFLQAISVYHQDGLTDDKIPPLVSADLDSPLIADGDSLVFFNFREDSMRQLVRAFADANFEMFSKNSPSNLYIATFTEYLNNANIHQVFDSLEIKNNLAEWLSTHQKVQLHIAESEKYAHATFFFNGLKDKIYEGETDLLLESPTDLAENPQMRALDIAGKVVEEMKNDRYDFILINFANADILSHLGNIQVVAKGIEYIDEAIGMIYQEMNKKGGAMIVTSDHGNAETLAYGLSGERETKHNLNPVRIYLIADQFQGKSMPDDISGILADVAPTILELMDLPIPSEMTGESLLKNLK
ncbi:MAG: 2,3-bisphosphoglycerate-independent phosphoglycerate mutase [Candidatus Taylorbacteria bacterium]|nr:2,3-bisphosphoglycerate-independent phosphoglycerate mutase [Candidatus Taylorbacteria bacterium]